jgi:hypothetical protein
MQALQERFHSHLRALILESIDKISIELKKVEQLIVVDRSSQYYQDGSAFEGKLRLHNPDSDHVDESNGTVDLGPPSTWYFQGEWYYEDEEGITRKGKPPVVPKRKTHKVHFEGLHPVDKHLHVLEDLKNYVYRPPFMDVLADVRTIREACEQTEDASIEDFEEMAVRLETLYADLALLPLPKELYVRVDREIKDVKEAVALTL